MNNSSCGISEVGCGILSDRKGKTESHAVRGIGSEIIGLVNHALQQDNSHAAGRTRVHVRRSGAGRMLKRVEGLAMVRESDAEKRSSGFFPFREAVDRDRARLLRVGMGADIHQGFLEREFDARELGGRRPGPGSALQNMGTEFRKNAGNGPGRDFRTVMRVRRQGRLPDSDGWRTWRQSPRLRRPPVPCLADRRSGCLPCSP